MKKITSILILTLVISSCYTYKPYESEIVESQITNNSKSAINRKIEQAAVKQKPSDNEISLNKKEIAKVNAKSKENSVEHRNSAELVENLSPITEATPKTIIKEKGYYQLEVFETPYKMEAVKWEGDTIVGFVKGKPNKPLKFHQKDITNLKVRQFSKARSDAFTVASYAAAGIGVFLLLK